MVARLEKEGVPYGSDPRARSNELQINIHDYDGNHIHIDFTAEEADASGVAAKQFGAMSPT